MISGTQSGITSPKTYSKRPLISTNKKKIVILDLQDDEEESDEEQMIFSHQNRQQVFHPSPTKYMASHHRPVKSQQLNDHFRVHPQSSQMIQSINKYSNSRLALASSSKKTLISESSQRPNHQKSSKSISTQSKMTTMKKSFPKHLHILSPRLSPDRIIRLRDISPSEEQTRSPRYMSPIEPHLHTDYLEPEFYEPYKEKKPDCHHLPERRIRVEKPLNIKDVFSRTKLW
ncbi:hypothetical protein FGO68_gene15912 [Halteria grandinella]|uniref:Uncharacterized protein n=1 Tax=Halteria grandinella TaxID=5974 RepID=A0A8J8SV57_HALGN|nr:hypothetical protein FGO68_gene15912 [Halteria grandinella]